MQKHLRNSIAALATSALTLGAVALASPAHATTDVAPARLTAQWLTSNLNAAGLLESHSEYGGQIFSGPSYGTSADLAFGLAALGGHDATVARVVAALEKDLSSYVSYGDSYYAGSGAKALALLQSQGRDTTALAAQVKASVITSGPSAGRLADQDPTPDEYWADYSNTIGQAFAARALTGLGATEAGSVTDYLLAQQCEAGFFRLYFNGDKNAPAQNCDGATPAEPAAQSPDTTALVILQLAAIEKPSAQAQAALSKAVAWLAAQQQADGSFVDPQNGANANTTGLAGWALRESGEAAAAAKAATWLRALQVVEPCAPAAMKGENGAVAYDANAWELDQKFGVTDLLDRSQWVIADVQALPALLAAPAAAAKDAVVLPKFAKAGTSVTARVHGIAPGERACVTGAAKADLLGTGAAQSVKLAKVAAGKKTVTLKTGTGSVSGTVHALGKKKFVVKVAKLVKPGAKKTVTVRGLAAGEKVTLRLKGKKVATGKATKKGTFTKKVKFGAKRGSSRVTVTGQFSHRTGAAKVKVA